MSGDWDLSNPNSQIIKRIVNDSVTDAVICCGNAFRYIVCFFLFPISLVMKMILSVIKTLSRSLNRIKMNSAEMSSTLYPIANSLHSFMLVIAELIVTAIFNTEILPSRNKILFGHRFVILSLSCTFIVVLFYCIWRKFLWH